MKKKIDILADLLGILLMNTVLALRNRTSMINVICLYHKQENTAGKV